MKKKRIVVIGDGIAAWCTLFSLKKEIFERGILDKIEIIQIAENDFAPPCTLASTAINCLRGTKKGLSELGDLIYDSYEYFKELHERFEFKGIEKGVERQLWRKNSTSKEKWEKRYADFKEKDGFYYYDSEAYLLTPETLGENLKRYFFSHTFYKTFVTKIEEKKIYSQVGEFEFDRLILCLSHEAKLFSSLYKNVDKKIVTHAKPVAGSFLEFDLDLKQSGFSYALENHHLIYKDYQKKLFIGSTTENQSDFYLADKRKLKQIYTEIFETFKNETSIPSFDEGKIKTGIRQKGYKRLPFFGKIDEDIFAMHSLYKNGFTFAFLGGKVISEKVLAKIL